jgi:hypothetical protein
LQLAADNYGYVRSQWGERRQVSVYSLDIGVGFARLLAVDMAADTQSGEIVLGRNILNKLILTLNGPKQFLELQA